MHEDIHLINFVLWLFIAGKISFLEKLLHVPASQCGKTPISSYSPALVHQLIGAQIAPDFQEGAHVTPLSDTPVYPITSSVSK